MNDYQMSTIASENINGKFLYYAFLSGSKRILQNQAEINRINVFPVSDKDTGTNLASTMRSVVDSISPHKSYKTTVGNIAEAALIGARGNSGVIFAQFLYGMSEETANRPTISLKEFSESVKKSIPYIYDAIANPVEGTILTVIKDWADYIESKNTAIHNFRNVIIESFEVLERSLKETTSKLGELNKHGFVDAGAKGFVLFIEGIIDFVKNRNVRTLVEEQAEAISLIHSEEISDEPIEHRYCTEAMLKKVSIEKDELKDILNGFGDSTVVAGSKKTSRIHVHTNHPAELFYHLKDYATITYQKVDDMVRQQQAATDKKWNIALVTDSTCDLPQDLLDHYQVNVVPMNLNFGENHYLDKVTIQPDQFYKLLKESDVFPNTSQVNERTFTNLYSHLASHYDAIISIHLSQHLSGTYAGAVRAGERIQKEFNKPVHVIDSKILSGGLGLQVLAAAREIEAGRSIEEVRDKVESIRQNTKVYVSVKNLKYMIKGGRVSKPKGFIASLLGLNPVVTIGEDGKSAMFGKTFSQRASLAKVLDHIKKESINRKISDYIIMHAHNEEGALKLEEKMMALADKKALSIIDAAPAIGMNTGIGTLAVALQYHN